MNDRNGKPLKVGDKVQVTYLSDKQADYAAEANERLVPHVGKTFEIDSFSKDAVHIFVKYGVDDGLVLVPEAVEIVQ
jgi:hypothetical protein